MSWLERTSAYPRYRSPVVAPTFWCVTCQMSLRNEDERVAHLSVLPTHAIKPVKRLACPHCGNDMALEHGAFPQHWLGNWPDTRICLGSGRRP